LRQLEASDRLTPEKMQAFENVSFSYDTNMKMLDETKKELEKIALSIKIKGFGRIICTGTIYQGTKVSIGDASLAVDDTMYNTMLYYDKGAVGIASAR
jgi:uncharacterized protein (DUF342 family)